MVMNKKGQVFMIAAIIFITLFYSTKQIYTFVKDSNNDFKEEERLYYEFKNEINPLLDQITLQNLQRDEILEDYINVFLQRSKERNVDWKFSFKFDDYEFNKDLVINIENQKDKKAYFKFISEKDGEVYVNQNY